VGQRSFSRALRSSFSLKHSPTSAPALVVERLSVVYPGTKRLALRDMNLIVPVGARVALVGAGKSTLLTAVAKLLPIRGGGSISQ